MYSAANGNQELYDTAQMALSVSTLGIVQTGFQNPGGSTYVSKTVNNYVGDKLTSSKLFGHNNGYGYSFGTTEKNGRGRIECFYRYSSGKGGTFMSINDSQGT